jgi:hypothetical protein
MTRAAVEQRLSRLVRKGVLKVYRLDDSRKYYVLSREAARAHGLFDERAGMGLGYQASRQNYAMSASCVLSDLKKRRLNRDEIAAWLPPLRDAVKKHFRTRYFIDTSARERGEARLGLFVVDFGQKLRNVGRKVRKEVERRRANAFEALIRERLLTICVLTGHERKAEQIRSTLSDLPVPLRVEAVPGYGALMLKGRP